MRSSSECPSIPGSTSASAHLQARLLVGCRCQTKQGSSNQCWHALSEVPTHGSGKLSAMLCKALTSRCSMLVTAGLSLGTYTADEPGGPSRGASLSMGKNTAYSSAELSSGRPRQSSPSHMVTWSAATADGPTASVWSPSSGA